MRIKRVGPAVGSNPQAVDVNVPAVIDREIVYQRGLRSLYRIFEWFDQLDRVEGMRNAHIINEAVRNLRAHAREAESDSPNSYDEAVSGRNRRRSARA